MKNENIMKENLKLQRLQTKYNRLLAFCAVLGLFMTLLIFFSNSNNLHNLIARPDNTLNIWGLGVAILVGAFMVYTAGLAIDIIFRKDK